MKYLPLYKGKELPQNILFIALWRHIGVPAIGLADCVLLEFKIRKHLWLSRTFCLFEPNLLILANSDSSLKSKMANLGNKIPIIFIM